MSKNNRVAGLRTRWLTLCKDIDAEARRQGATAPEIFACESGLCVLDGPPFDDQEKARSKAVLFTLPRPVVIKFDAGGW